MTRAGGRAAGGRGGGGQGGGSLLELAALGLALGVLTWGAGFVVVGMGHGWDLPSRMGALALLAWPLALLRLSGPGPATPPSRDPALLLLPALWIWGVVGFVPAPDVPGAARALIVLGPVAAYWAAYWAAEAAARGSLHRPLLADAGLLGVGLLLDRAAWADHGDPNNLYPASLVGPWLILWLGWQAVAGAALLRHLAARPPSKVKA